MAIYNQKVYEWMQGGSHKAAEIIVPEIIKLIRPQRIIDIGCGTGEWLDVFKRHGVREVLGVDGGWFSQDLLQITPEEFIKLDFTRDELKINRTFDLVVTLEAIHHVPKEKIKDFIRQIAQLAPVILFSSPIPYQKGSGFNVNEQWLDYWAELFKENGFFAADCLRDKLWANKRIEWWYSQNMVIFADKNRIGHLPELIKEIDATPQPPLRRIHPTLFLRRMSQGAENASLAQLIKALPHAAMMEIKKLLNLNND